jgi:cobalamin biosynthesis Mg chelatase CobN
MRFTTAVMCLAMVSCAFAMDGKTGAKTGAKTAGKKADKKTEKKAAECAFYLVDMAKVNLKEAEMTKAIKDWKASDYKTAVEAFATQLKTFEAVKATPEEAMKTARIQLVKTDYVAYITKAFEHIEAIGDKQLEEAKTAADTKNKADSDEDKKYKKMKAASDKHTAITAAILKVATFDFETVFEKEDKKHAIKDAEAKKVNAFLVAVQTEAVKYAKECEKAGFTGMTSFAEGSTKKDSSFPLWAIILIVVAVVAIVGGIVFFMMKKKNESD